jgi:hypothetical protein
MKCLPRIFLAIALLLLSLASSLAQLQTNVLLSDSLKLDFRTLPPSVKYFPIGLDSRPACHGSSAIAYTDANGKMVVAMGNTGRSQDGGFLDSVGNPINGCLPYGACLYPPPLVLRHPNSSYFHFLNISGDTTTCGGAIDFCMKLYHHTVKFDSINNIYQVTRCNELRYSALLDLSLAQIKHANGKDWWVLLHSKSGNSFVKFLLSNDSLFGPFLQNEGPITVQKVLRGNIDFNYKTNLLLHSINGDKIDLFRFSRCDGRIEYLSSPRNGYIVDLSDTSITFSSYFSNNGKSIFSISGKRISYVDTGGGNKVTLLIRDSLYSQDFARTTFFSRLFKVGTNFFFNYFCTRWYLSMPNNGCNIDYQKSIGIIENIDSSVGKIKITPKYLNVGRRAFGFLPQLVDYDAPAISPLPNGCFSPTSVSEVETSILKVYPNPAATSITLNAEQGKLNGRLSFYNLSGQVVYKAILSNETSHEWNVSGLPNGIYYLRLTDGMSQPFVQKVVVSR